MVIEILLGLGALGGVVFLVLWRRAESRLGDSEYQLVQKENWLREAALVLKEDDFWMSALQTVQTGAVFLVTPQQMVRAWNPTAKSLFGEQLHIGQSLIRITRSAELEELVGRAMEGATDCDQPVALGVDAQPYRARACRAGTCGVVLALQDISELQRLGRARRDFVANISHELRTPLTSIRLLIERLQTNPAGAPDERIGLLEKVNLQVHVLEQMAQELLDLAQIESGRAIARLVSVPLAPLIACTVERFEPQAGHKRQEIIQDISQELTVLADPDQISRALGNLLHNAIKFTPASGTIWVRASEQVDEVIVEIADTGDGIPPGDLPRVFERFFRGDRSRMREQGGTGLGLAIAKHVVEAHGGRLWVESRGIPGEGATFRLSLLTERNSELVVPD